MSEPPTLQPKIASFAPELIDEILAHLEVSVEADGPEPWSRTQDPSQRSPRIEALQSVSLVSKSWTGLAQIRMMRRLVVKSGTQVASLTVAPADSARDARAYVKELTIKGSSGASFRWGPLTPAEIVAVDGVTGDHFIALLSVLKEVTSIELEYPDFTSVYLTPSEPMEFIQEDTSDITKVYNTNLHGLISTVNTLEYIARSQTSMVDIARVLQSCTALEDLHLSLWNHESEAKFTLPSTIRSLAFAELAAANDVLTHLASIPTGLKTRQHAEKQKEQLARVVDLCKRAEVELIGCVRAIRPTHRHRL
ncbi:hypothetical protein RQP46_001042 [Phenoliferia psychrophenolica]